MAKLRRGLSERSFVLGARILKRGGFSGGHHNLKPSFGVMEPLLRLPRSTQPLPRGRGWQGGSASQLTAQGRDPERWLCLWQFEAQKAFGMVRRGHAQPVLD